MSSELPVSARVDDCEGLLGVPPVGNCYSGHRVLEDEATYSLALAEPLSWWLGSRGWEG